jgi:uncharacterized membrane protein
MRIPAILMMLLIALSMRGVTEAQVDQGPAVRWSLDEVAETMEVGSSKTLTITMRSRVDLANVSLWLSPSVSQLITVKPSLIETLPANQEQEITLTIRIPASAQTGEEGGTLHVKRGEATVPAPLGINLRLMPKKN